MNIETQCAYHESARVLYAYKSGYYCESIELSNIDPGGGSSKLNGRADNEIIQCILSSKLISVELNDNKVIEVAKNLMKIYCAGACAVAFLNNGLSVPLQTEIEIPGQDIKYINMIQSFLKKKKSNHSDNFPSQVITQIFTEISKDDNWKTIQTLADFALKMEDKKITRFYIEDALMKAGFRRPVQQAEGRSFEMKVREEDTPEKKQSIDEPGNDNEKSKLLNSALTGFLKLVKKDWTDEELKAALNYLKDVFRKFK